MKKLNLIITVNEIEGFTDLNRAECVFIELGCEVNGIKPNFDAETAEFEVASPMPYDELRAKLDDNGIC